MSVPRTTNRRANLPSLLLLAAILVAVPATMLAVHLAGKGRIDLIYGTASVVLLIIAGAVIAGQRQLAEPPVMDPIAALRHAAARLGVADIAVRTGLSHDNTVVGELARKLDELAAHGQRVTRALRTLSAGNRTLLRERSEEKLLSEMCRVAVEQAGYRIAFVNYAEQDEAQSVRTVARSGRDDGFIDLLKLSWGDKARGRGSVGTAIRTGKPTVIRSMAVDPRFRPWREAAVERGFGSVASLPLNVNGTVIGTFTLIAAEEDAFDLAEVELLEEMAADLSFGIEVIRAEGKRRQAEESARRALTHDTLVDLPNRPTFIAMVASAIDGARKSGSDVAVLSVHVGRLPEIFESFGYEPYRKVLREIAARLSALPACQNALARLPMEDFGVLLASKSLNTLGVIANSLLEPFKMPISIGEVQLDVRAAVGVSFFPEHGEDGESLIRRASISAKEAFRRDIAFEVYKGHSERENPERLALAADLRAAIDGDRLHLHYQPKIRLANGDTIGYEALVRWNHPLKGALPPAAFIPVAEQMGMIGPMTNNVIRMAVRQLHAWELSGRRLPIAVNLSARNLHDPVFVTKVERCLRSYNISGELLHFEITEGALMEEPEAAKEALARLRGLGSKIYIDDFGTGYSSLSYLATLPVNSLKIDRSFIHQMGSSHQALGVVSSIISMAHNLEMGVVAEGVETPEQKEALKRLGCDEAQGHLFGKPAPAERLP